MELLNATKMKAAYAMGMKPDGRELLVVVVKGTFSIPKSPSEVPELAEKQADLVMADEFTGEPGLSAPKYESDFAPFKPRCDVLLNGSAYAPGGQPVKRIRVGLRVGAWEKTFTVVGHRFWRKWLWFISITSAVPFVKMPISYDNAFGGIDRSQPEEKKQRFFVKNPAGRGYHYYLNKKALHGKPLPNTEETGRRVRRPCVKYRPMAFGSIGRGWQPRPRFAGTYDQNWLDNVFPFLPADFNDLYYQCAPADQQIDQLRGGELVHLLNLTPEGHTDFKLPKISMPITFYRKNGEEIEQPGINDTILIEPDLRRFILIWRAALPLKKNMFEMARVVVGTMPGAWYRARETGKTWYPSLKDLVDERAAERAKASEETEEPAEEVET
jgi:hypothetical protein